jgi:hypothetical protein
MKRKFTVATLRSFGMDGAKWYDDWDLLPGSRVIDVQGHESDVVVTFVTFEHEETEHEEKLWQFTVSFPSEDWSCNDLAQYVDDHEIEAEEAKKVQVTRYVPK